MQIPKYDELKARLRFDPLRIDEELVEYPAYVQEASEMLADKIAERDRLDHALDLIKADIEAHVRRKMGDTKMTENAIKAAVLLDTEVITATEDLQKAKHSAGIWTALVDGIKQKSYSMSRYTDLLLGGFIARDSAYQERREQMNERRQFRRRETGSST